MFLSTALFAVGLTLLFLPRYVDTTYWPGDELPNVLAAALGMALPAGGIGAMFTRTLKGLYIGLGVGALFVLACYLSVLIYTSV
jgi:hypothetical protein